MTVSRKICLKTVKIVNTIRAFCLLTGTNPRKSGMKHVSRVSWSFQQDFTDCIIYNHDVSTFRRRRIHRLRFKEHVAMLAEITRGVKGRFEDHAAKNRRGNSQDRSPGAAIIDDRYRTRALTRARLKCQALSSFPFHFVI